MFDTQIHLRAYKYTQLLKICRMQTTMRTFQIDTKRIWY